MKKKYSKIINKIEKIRAKNNTNWMNILRLSFKFAPNEASKLVNKINSNDKNISKLLKQIGKK